jgi:hypothetical protein
VNPTEESQQPKADARSEVSVRTLWQLLFWGVPLVLGLAALWSAVWPPMLDWPLHMAQGVLVARGGDTAFVPAGVYCKTPLSAYHFFHYIVAGVYWVVGPDGLSRVMGTLLYAGFLGATWSLLRAYRADIRLLSMAMPLFFGFSYIMGFGPFLLGIVGSLFAFAAAERWSRTKLSAHARWACYSLLFVYLLHPLAFYLTLVAMGFRWSVEWVWERDTRWAATLIVLFPGLLSLFHLVAFSQYAKGQQDYWSTIQMYFPTWSWTIAEPSLWTKVLRFPLYALGNERLSTPDVLLACGWLLVLVSLVVLVVWRQHREGNEPKGTWRKWLGRASLLLVGLGFYVGFGKAFQHINHVYPRFAIFGVLGLFVWIRRDALGKWGGWLLVFGWCVSVAFGINNVSYHIGWERGMSGLQHVLKRIPQNKKVLGLLTHRRHAPAIVQVYRGGEARSSFTHVQHMPVVDCNPYRQVHTWPLSLRPWTFRPEKLEKWDFLLLYIVGGKRKMMGLYPWLFRKGSAYRPVFRVGRWLLVKHTGK